MDELLGILFGQLSEGAAGTGEELQARLTLAIRDLRHLVVPLAGPLLPTGSSIRSRPPCPTSTIDWPPMRGRSSRAIPRPRASTR